MNVIRDRLQSMVKDCLTIHAGHGVIRVAHHVVRRDLITGVASDRFESVSQSIERETGAIDFGLVGQLAKRFGHWIIDGLFEPTSTSRPAAR